MAATIPCLVAFLLALGTAQALTCYRCDSSESTLCAYGFTSFTFPSENCEGEGINLIPHQCAKLTAKTASGKEYIARGCVPAVGEFICNTAVKTAGFFASVEEKTDVSCSLCSEDKCNSSSKAVFTVVGLLLSSIALLL